MNDAIALRPELVLARQELKVRQLEVINQKNLLLPDLHFTSTYGISGIGSQLDGGSDPNNAFHSLATDRFTDWSLGLRLDIPIGFRDAHAGLRAARLLLAQSYAVLQDQELKAQRYLALQYRLLSETYERIGAARSQREAAAQQLTLRSQEFAVGRGTLEFLLAAQIAWANALRDEYALVADYNNALATFEFATGTILQRDNVVIGDGPLPGCAVPEQSSTSANAPRRSFYAQRAKPVLCAPAMCPPANQPSAVPLASPVLSPWDASSLPTLMENGAFIPGGEEPPNLEGPDDFSGLDMPLTRPTAEKTRQSLESQPAITPNLGRTEPRPPAAGSTDGLLGRDNAVLQPTNPTRPNAVPEPGAGGSDRESDSLRIPSRPADYLPPAVKPIGDSKANTPTTTIKKIQPAPGGISESDSLSLPREPARQIPKAAADPLSVKRTPAPSAQTRKPEALPAISDSDSLSIPQSGASRGESRQASDAKPVTPTPRPSERQGPVPVQGSESDSLAIPAGR